MELVQVGYSRAWLTAGASADTEVTALGLYQDFFVFRLYFCTGNTNVCF